MTCLRHLQSFLGIELIQSCIWVRSGMIAHGWFLESLLFRCCSVIPNAQMRTHTPSNCCWYLGVEKNRATHPLTDQAPLDWLRTNPWNSWIGCRPSAHFLCVWEELQPPELKCISWLCIKLLLMTRSASEAMLAHPHPFPHPLIHSLITGEGKKERMMEVKMSCKEKRCDASQGREKRVCVSVRDKQTLMDGLGDGKIELSETNQSWDIKRSREKKEIGRGFSIGSQPTVSLTVLLNYVAAHCRSRSPPFIPLTIRLTQKYHS